MQIRIMREIDSRDEEFEDDVNEYLGFLGEARIIKVETTSQIVDGEDCLIIVITHKEC